MSIVTIIIEDERMTVIPQRIAKSRLVWRAAGLDVFVIGAMDKLQFEQASQLAMIECQTRHIPLISLRYQKSATTRSNSSTEIDMYKKGLL